MNHSFTAIAGAYTENVAETSGDLPEMLISCARQPAILLRARNASALGRTFNPEEDLMTGPWAAVLSESLWRRRFGSDPHVLGKQLIIGRTGYPIVGVVPDSVRFPADHVDFWIPAKLPPSSCATAKRASTTPSAA